MSTYKPSCRETVLQIAFPLVADTIEAGPLAEPKISVRIELKNDITIADQGVEGASPATLKIVCSPCAGAASWEFPLSAVMVTVTAEYIIGAVTVIVIYVVVASRASIRGRSRKFIGRHKPFAAMIQMMASD